MTYRPRSMPARYMEGAPEIVRENVLEILRPDCDSDYAIYWATDGETRFGPAAEIMARAIAQTKES